MLRSIIFSINIRIVFQFITNNINSLICNLELFIELTRFIDNHIEINRDK